MTATRSSPPVGQASPRSREGAFQVAGFVLMIVIAPLLFATNVASALQVIVTIVLFIRFSPMLWRANDVCWDGDGITGPYKIGFFCPPRREYIGWLEAPRFYRTISGFHLQAGSRKITWTSEYSAQALFEALAKHGVALHDSGAA